MNYDVQEERMELNDGGEQSGAVLLEDVPMEGAAGESEFAGDGVNDGAVEDAASFAEQGDGQLEPDVPMEDSGETAQEAQEPAEEKPKRKRTSRKKAAEGLAEAPQETPGESEPEDGDPVEAALDEDASDGVDASDSGGEEHDAETAAFVLEETGEPGDPEAASLDGADPGDAEEPAEEPASAPAAAPPIGGARPRRVRRTAAAETGPKEQFASRPLKNKPALLSLDLNELDRDLTEEEREEWNAIYASYRSKSLLTGRIMGIDTHSFTVRNRETGQIERRRMQCAVIISYRVKVLVPETEVWMPGQERPPYVLRNMTGAEIDYTIMDVDREGGVAIGSRRMAMLARRHFFDTARNGHELGEKLTCRVLSVGPKRCLVECGGRDMSLSQKDLTYTATPDLRERYHPGQELDCILKEYNRQSGQMWVSVKETMANPFFGAIKRHPIGSRRQAVISGKYGGGVFCTLPDETVCLCLYSTRHSDSDFHVGDTVILAIKQFDYERHLIYGRILSKW